MVAKTQLLLKFVHSECTYIVTRAYFLNCVKGLTYHTITYSIYIETKQSAQFTNCSSKNQTLKLLGSFLWQLFMCSEALCTHLIVQIVYSHTHGLNPTSLTTYTWFEPHLTHNIHVLTLCAVINAVPNKSEATMAWKVILAITFGCAAVLLLLIILLSVFLCLKCLCKNKKGKIIVPNAFFAYYSIYIHCKK